MQRLSIALLVLLALYFAHQLLRDDPLLPEAQQWLAITNQQPDLDNNALIYLLGLDQAGVDYANALQLYQQALQDKSYSSPPLHYPRLPGLRTVELATLDCQLTTPECQQHLLVQRQETEFVIQQYQASLAAFYKLLSFDNFTNVDTFITKPQFDELTKLYRLAANEIYYLITDNQLDEAASKLAALLTIERSLMRNSAEMILHVFPIINAESLYQPLIVKLHQAGFKKWAVFDIALAPLSNEERLMNKVWQFEFANQVNAMQNILQVQNINYLSYKPNMTINILAKYYQTYMPSEDITPMELLAVIETSKLQTEAFAEEARTAQQPWRFKFYNYRNIAGTLLAYTIRPRVLDFQTHKLELDLRLQLLDAVVHTTRAADLDTDRYRNPYTGQPSYLNERQLCHKLEQEICVPWPHGQQTTLTSAEQ